MIQHRRHLKVYGILYTRTFMEFRGIYVPFLLYFLVFLTSNFNLKVYGIPYTWTYAEIHVMARNFAVLYSKQFAELREIKSIPYKILYSAEFQKGTSKNTLYDSL